MVKNLPANAGDVGSIPDLERSPGEESGNPFQCSCLENPRDRGAWWAAVYGVTQSRTRLKRLSSSSSSNHFNSVHIWLVLVKRSHRSKSMHPAGSASKHYYLTVQSSVTTMVLYFRCSHPAHLLWAGAATVFGLLKKKKQQ